MEVLLEDLIKIENILNEIITTGDELKRYLEFPLYEKEEKLNYLVIIPIISTLKMLNRYLNLELKSITGENIGIPRDLADLEFDLRVLLETEHDINNIKDKDFLERIYLYLSELNKSQMVNEILNEINQ
ncbi:hypothetical protein BU002_02185 [Mammaliicoccus sciuri]|uniref:hypothetical protein n=1 Tax=Mammaliicoccus sciuri TaxID=1296 RepID=UPI000E682B69|nr:hypothetical protein [Mammaliicoccus sciuri]RIN97149.1 hypothetical protein BU002_02185 [Mammaliicoccus sciuri]